MWKNNTAGLNSLPVSPDEQQTAPVRRTGQVKNLVVNHKGKLAVGVAAMLGIAIYYKWHKFQLAREEPVEYARLQRLKQAVCPEEEQDRAQQGKAL
jgi:hypothetical protein